jgi:hypothetical protein
MPIAVVQIKRVVPNHVSAAADARVIETRVRHNDLVHGPSIQEGAVRKELEDAVLFKRIHPGEPGTIASTGRYVAIPSADLGPFVVKRERGLGGVPPNDVNLISVRCISSNKSFVGWPAGEFCHTSSIQSFLWKITVNEAIGTKQHESVFYVEIVPTPAQADVNAIQHSSRCLPLRRCASSIDRRRGF